MREGVPATFNAAMVFYSNAQQSPMFGKARCKVCGDEVRLTLKHFPDKHRDIYEAEVAGKMKMADFMRKYFD